jgi:hypothetical protein
MLSARLATRMAPQPDCPGEMRPAQNCRDAFGRWLVNSAETGFPSRAERANPADEQLSTEYKLDIRIRGSDF